jgi:hypothetical protein
MSPGGAASVAGRGEFSLKNGDAVFGVRARLKGVKFLS